MAKKDKEPEILIIDSDLKRRQALASRLRTNPTVSYKIEAGGGGFQALSLIENNTFDLIILIDDFSDMPASEVIGLSRDSVQLKTPILYMSEQENLAKFSELFGRGATACELLTSNFNDLLNLIKKHLPTS